MNPLLPLGVIRYVRATAVGKPTGIVFARLTLTSAGRMPDWKLIDVKGLPKLSGTPAMNPVRFTLPTTSVVPIDVAVFGIVKVDEPVVRSPVVKASVPLTVRSAPN